MKILGIVGAAIGAIAAILGGYLQFALVPEAEIADSNREIASEYLGEAYYGSAQQSLDFAAHDAAMDFAIVVMGVGLLAFLISIVPAFKKQHIAWIGVGLGIVTFFLGAAHGTHMFS